jgi:pyruvate/2-oxoacid:ferredoxin oxidoreductase alpha subunit
MEVGQTVSALMTGYQAAAHAVKAAHCQVIASHPVMPPLLVFDQLADFCREGILRARLIETESAFSAMAALVGASAAGARTFTATSSQSLAQTHELLHWAAGNRLPIVIANINRALGAPWSMWVDHNDSLSQRDTGWLQFYASSSQEVYDTILQAYRLTEKVGLPAMINLDGYFLSDTMEPVNLPSQDQVDLFLPPCPSEWQLNPDHPHSVGCLAGPDYYPEFRYKAHEAMKSAAFEIDAIAEEFGERFGRSYQALETYQVSDAETVFIASGTMALTVKHAVREMRNEGKKVGLIRLRVFRPFPADMFRELVVSGRRYIILDRNISLGSNGILDTEIRACLASSTGERNIVGITLGLGGRDVNPTTIHNIEARFGADSTLEDDHVWEGIRL